MMIRFVTNSVNDREMKNILPTFIIAFLAGILGAWSYQAFNFSGNNNSPHAVIEHRTPNLPVSYHAPVPKAETSLPVSFVDASEKSMESVVFIKNFAGTDYRRYSMFDYFFGERGASPQQVSTGSGVIISGDGYIITNNHVEIGRAHV